MEPIFIVAATLVCMVLLKVVFKINIKKAEPLKEDKELEALTDKFPENIDIAKEMLEMLDNKNVKIEEGKSTETSLYIAITNKILIADMKNNYARIQTIAHESLHSIQDRSLLLFNFIFSNIIIIYWLAISILTATHVITNIAPFAFALVLMAMVKLAVRGFLETDAMTKARYLSEKYIDSKKILNQNEKEKLLAKYDKINALGVPYTIVYIMLGSLIGILVFGLIALIL